MKIQEENLTEIQLTPKKQEEKFVKLSDRCSDTFRDRALLILQLAIPSTLFGLLRKGTEITNIVFIGYMDNEAELAGIGMGNMIANLAAMSVV